ncbi:LytTR family DNA-binding domain-containing protein [Marivivens aquimaris]|uniref:LytTR family DNA-binding domain-containing protein n=1 Tax=Marivivens aquimaris TaxID=2774876 RepID=UPI00187ED9F8|nr:LytTR family DNA-binding domain-containing protein [Marivivens aquimaris]
MTDTPSHSAIREWRRYISKPITLVMLCGTAVVLTLVAPFESDRLMRPLPRLGYWLVMVFATYSVGLIVSVSVERLARVTLYARYALIAVSSALAITATVLLVNLALLGYWPDMADAMVLIPTVFGIAVIISLMVQVASDHMAHPPQPETKEALPPILDRLPYDKRAPLVAISVEDHYVRVRTHNGEAVILMRLTDAMREVGQTDGLQVHRSHWVARDAVTAARREGDRAILTVSHGEDIPVSRRYVPAIKEAGFLPG